MVSMFRYEVASFLSKNMIEYRISDGYIVISGHKIVLSLMDINPELRLERSDEPGRELKSGSIAGDGYKQFTIYEDLWFTKGNIVRNRLLANFGMGERIFARRCRVGKINAETAKKFLEANHLIGDARSVFRYGLFYGEELVSVATFSASRPMERHGKVVRSYEWVRYANRSALRIVGGMGKLLNHFVVVEKPDEVMSYADIDWSDGDVYRKLGFKQIGETSPVMFYVNSDTYERIPGKKLLRDKKYIVADNDSVQGDMKEKTLQDNPAEENLDNNMQEKFPPRENLPKNLPLGRYISIFNSGNLKFLKSFSIL